MKILMVSFGLLVLCVVVLAGPQMRQREDNSVSGFLKQLSYSMCLTGTYEVSKLKNIKYTYEESEKLKDKCAQIANEEY